MPCELFTLPKDEPQEKKICANYVAGSGLPPAYSCVGDSGGPLTVNENGYRVVIGIVSYEPLHSSGMCTPHPQKPDVYTEVQAYLPWIKKVIGQGLEIFIFYILTYKVVMFL